jgi:Icc-related predicted phosphoesterase
MLILCLADIHGDAAGLRAILSEVPGAGAVVVAGDITQLGGAVESEAILAPLLATGARVIAVAGNMDRAGAREYLARRGIDIHGRGTVIEGIGFFGLGGGTHSPFSTPWELDDEEASLLLSAGWAEIESAPRKVLVAHAPPRQTELDRVRAGIHAGSSAVRDFLLSHRVDLCVSGHIHEAGGRQARVGSCLCLNVGPFRAGRYALVSLGADSPEAPRVEWRTK